MYANPAWSGFCAAADIGKLNTFLNRCRKLYRFRQLNQDIYELFSPADQSLRLCKQTVNMSSIAFYWLNQPSLIIFVLAVTVFLVMKDNPAMDDCNFITRMLYYDIY